MALWRRLWSTCKKLESRRTPPGIHNLEAMHTLALFWSMLGMIVPVWVSARTYLSSTPYFLNATSASVVPRNGASYVTDLSKELPSNDYIDTPIGVEFIIPCAEPFAALANLAYFTAGLGLYMMPFLSGDFMPAPVFGVAIFLCVLGACSWAFHADASQLFTWKHNADRFAMFMPFAFMSIVQFNGLVHALRGVPASPRSLVGLATNVGGMFFAVYVLVSQEQFDAMSILISCGFVIFTCDFLTIALLHYHRMTKEDATIGQQPDHKKRSIAMKVFHSILRALPTLVVRLLALGIGFYCRIAGVAHLNNARDQARDDASRIEERTLHDFTHGTWHFFTAVVLMGLGLGLCEGLSGELSAPRGLIEYRPALVATSTSWKKSSRTLDVHLPTAKDEELQMSADALAAADNLVREYAVFFQREDPWEMTSLVLTALIAIVAALLTGLNASSKTWCVGWIIILIVALPVEACALYKVVSKHNRLLDRLAESEVIDVDEAMRA